MELNLEKVRQYSSIQLFAILLETVNDIYESFSYLNISKQDYKDMVLREIELSQVQYKGDTPYSDYLRERLSLVLSNKVKTLLLNEETSFTIIDRYINYRYTETNSYADALNNFQDLDVFFKTYSFIPSTNILVELLRKNNILLRMIEYVMTGDYSKITSVNFEEVFSNTLQSIFDTYCMLYNV